MKYYYISNDNHQEGPFTFEELKNHRLTGRTLVWSEGQEDWVRASQVKELENLIIPTPPPLPNYTSENENNNTLNVNIGFKKPRTKAGSKQKKPITPKYDANYDKETSATFAGVGIIIFQVIIIGSGGIQSESAYAITSIFSLIMRIGITVWVVNIAERQNRNQTGWGFFAFLLPTIALIVIGLLKKLYVPEKLKLESLSSESERKQGFTPNDSNSVNGFNVHILETNPERNIKSAIGIDTFTIKYTLNNIERYMNFYKSKDYPFYAALELDRRGEILDKVQMDNLVLVAKQFYDESDVNKVFEKLKSAANST